MSISASGTFDVTITGVEVPLACALNIDVQPAGYGDFTLALESGTLNRSLTTDLTDGLRTEAGYSKADATFVLSGIVGTDETQNAAWFFNVNDPTSPMYRQAVKGLLTTLDLGVQAYGSASELLRVFTGRVSSVTLDHAAGTVALDVVDLAADWDVLPAIPSVVTVPPFNAGLTSEFVLDLIARSMPASPRYTWPAQRPQCVLAAGMRTSIWPEVGSIVTGSYGTSMPSFAAGVHGSALLGGAPGTHSPSYQLTTGIGTSMFAEFWVTGCSSGWVTLMISRTVGGSDTDDGYLRVDSTGVQFNGLNDSNNGSGHLFGPMDDGPHYVALKLTLPAVGGSVFSGTIYLDGQSASFTTPGTTGGVTTRIDGSWSYVESSVVAGATVEALQITTETSPTPNNTFAPSAFLDSSLNPLQVPPPVDAGAQAWDVIQQIAAAELGYARFDGAGNFRFSNRDTLQQQTAFRQVRSDSSLKTLQTVVGDFTEYQRVQVDYTDWRFKNAATVLAPQGAWKVAGNSTQTFLRDLGDTVAAQVLSPAQPWTSDPQGLTEPNDMTASYYRASRDKYGNTEHGYGTLTVTIETITPSRIAVTVQNSGGYDAWLVSPANYINLDVGSPALWVRGTPVVTDSPTIVEATYDPNGALYQAPTNPYRQDRDTAQAVAQYLLGQLHAAIPDYQGVEIIPDPRIEVGDKITLVDPDLSKAASMDVIVWGSSVNFGSGAWSQSLNVRAVAPPGAWLLGVAGRSELGGTNGGIATTGTAYLY